MLFGIGFGVATIARPALLADRYDTIVYATLSGTLALPATVAKAVAPLATVALATNVAGYNTVMPAVAVVCLIAAAGLTLTARRTADEA